MILSGTEIDTDFNLNSLTGTNGRIIGALGGAPDTAEGASLTVAVLPSMRGRIPTVNKKVRTVCSPSVDILVTERGICVNPLRTDLQDCLKSAGIETMPVQELSERIHRMTGVPQQPVCSNRAAAVVEDRHGKVLDTIFCLADSRERHSS